MVEKLRQFTEYDHYDYGVRYFREWTQEDSEQDKIFWESING